ncbi:MAG: 50S ribosomal protein L6 [Candidatus Nanohalobium sp.]
MTEKETVEIPESFEAEYEDGVLTVKGEDGEVSKKMDHAMIQIKVQDEEVEFSTESSKKDITSILGTYRGHVQNMVEGLQNPHVYKMEGVYAHFPMSIKQESGEVVIENFMGERNPRKTEIMEGVTVEVDGENLTLKGSDKEAVSQTAARIEQLCKKGDRDPRTFQDGVYITEADTSE